MFPIPWNRLFRKKDGSLVNIEEAMSGGGGGEASGEVRITRYVATLLQGAKDNVQDVSSEAPTQTSRLIGVVNDLAYYNKISTSSAVVSAVGLCFSTDGSGNPNCFYCRVSSDLRNMKFDLIWWVPSGT